MNMYCEQLTLHHAANHWVEHHHVPKPANICSPLFTFNLTAEPSMFYNLHDTATNTTRKALRATSPTTESIQHPLPITTGSSEKFPGKHLINQDLESRCTLTDFCQLLQISRGAHSAGREQRLIKTKTHTPLRSELKPIQRT